MTNDMWDMELIEREKYSQQVRVAETEEWENLRKNKSQVTSWKLINNFFTTLSSLTTCNYNRIFTAAFATFEIEHADMSSAQAQILTDRAQAFSIQIL